MKRFSNFGGGGNHLSSCSSAFTLAEVLVTLGIIGVVSAMTMPVLLGNSNDEELVAGVLKFHSTLSQAVMMWRNNTGAIDIAGSDADASLFDAIAKELKYTAKCVKSECKSVGWLPDYSYDYLGVKGTNVQLGAVAKQGYGNACYLLADGMAFCLDINPNYHCVTVDVNGKKKPNRVGRDIFSFTVGYNETDVLPEEAHCSGNTHVLSTHGTCCIGEGKCDASNLDPTQKGGAAPTSYVLLYKKLPPIYNGN